MFLLSPPEMLAEPAIPSLGSDEVPAITVDDLFALSGLADGWPADTDLDALWNDSTIEGPALEYGSWPAESWNLGDSLLDLGSGGYGDVDFGAIEMYSGDSLVSTSGFDY
jgi:hypothetical protein